jgi:hypothetical protein
MPSAPQQTCRKKSGKPYSAFRRTGPKKSSFLIPLALGINNLSKRLLQKIQESFIP